METVGTLSACMNLVAVLVDHELPEAVLGACGTKVSEVEGEDREAIALSDRHHRRVGAA